MSTFRRAVIVVAVTSGIGAFALHSCTSPSECFYILIPPVALAIYLTGVTDLRHTLATQIRSGATLTMGLFALSLGLAYLFLDRGVVLSWRFWLEVGTCLYFLASALIVLLSVRRALLAFAKALHERQQFAPGVRLLVCEVVPLAMFVMFALPYALAFAHVHRFKMPNLADPKQFHQREFEEIEITSADGTRLRGWWIPAKTPSRRTLMICHGIAANRSIFLPFVEAGDWLDANVLMFDLRAHGDSGGRTITTGFREKEDVLAAIAYARRVHPDESRQLIGFGISLGAASLAEAAALAEPPLDAVVLDSCFASTCDMSQSAVGAFPSACHPWLLTLGLPMAEWHAGCRMMTVRPEESVRNLRAPVLFLHSRGDPMIPSEHSSRVYQNAQEPKRLCIFELPGHCDGFFAQKERYRAEVISICNWRETASRDR